jgi:7SK snRNA methylphosphate capping enzyme
MLSLLNWTDSDLNPLGLIETAKWNLRTIARAGKVATRSAKVNNSSDSTTQSCPEGVVSEMSKGNISEHKQHNLFEIVSFRPDNFVQSTHRYSEQYDTIMW